MYRYVVVMCMLVIVAIVIGVWSMETGWLCKTKFWHDIGFSTAACVN